MDKRIIRGRIVKKLCNEKCPKIAVEAAAIKVIKANSFQSMRHNPTMLIYRSQYIKAIRLGVKFLRDSK